MMTPEKMMTVLDHIKGEIALIALHPEKGDTKYVSHVGDELHELSQAVRNLPPHHNDGLGRCECGEDLCSPTSNTYRDRLDAEKPTDAELLKRIQDSEKELTKRHPKDYR